MDAEAVRHVGRDGQRVLRCHAVLQRACARVRRPGAAGRQHALDSCMCVVGVQYGAGREVCARICPLRAVRPCYFTLRQKSMHSCICVQHMCMLCPPDRRIASMRMTCCCSDAHAASSVHGRCHRASLCNATRLQAATVRARCGRHPQLLTCVRAWQAVAGDVIPGRAPAQQAAKGRDAAGAGRAARPARSEHKQRQQQEGCRRRGASAGLAHAAGVSCREAPPPPLLPNGQAGCCYAWHRGTAPPPRRRYCRPPPPRHRRPRRPAVPAEDGLAAAGHPRWPGGAASSTKCSVFALHKR